MIEILAGTNNCTLVVDWDNDDFIVKVKDKGIEFRLDEEDDARELFFLIIRKVRSIEEVR